MALILRLYSYAYHAALCLVLLGLGTVAAASDASLRLDMFPWKGEDLTRWLFYLGVFGAISLLLAVTGRFRFLFPLWALLVVILMVRGFLLQPYTYSGENAFYWTLALIAGAILAFLASLTLFTVKKRR